MPVVYPLTIFYDGACGVCSTEISHYRSIADHRVRFVNIADVDFDAGAYGKPIGDFQKLIHARDAEGRYYIGVDAFRQLWEALPPPHYQLLSTFVGLPGINLAARTGYAIFARFRHLLPSSHSASCPITKKH